MIKIIYEQEPFYYDSGTQPYKAKTEFRLDKDIDADEAIIAFMKILNLATYRVNINTLERLIERLKDEGYREDERVI